VSVSTFSSVENSPQSQEIYITAKG